MPYNTTAIPLQKEPNGQTQLPLSRVKKIVSQDPDVEMCSSNAAFEMFIQHIAAKAHVYAKLDKKPRKNVQYKDIANAVSHQDNLEFLEDTVPKTMPFKKVMAVANAKQAHQRSGKTAPDDGLQSTLGKPAAPTAARGRGSGSTGSVFVNSDSAHFRVPLRTENRQDDPNEQLEMEMRQAAGDS